MQKTRKEKGEKAMNVERILENIPAYTHFLTVDEIDQALLALGQAYPDKVQVFEAGKSRKGSPIYCAKIGNGSRNAMMFGCPHPNEPIGAMMAHYFARAIAEDDALREALDFTWYILPVSDVDGTRLNEGWFKGPFTLYNYTRNYFRPASYEQVEWTFPMAYKRYTFSNPIPETQALMKIIDETKPVFLYSLHNSGFGGAYWYISKEQPQKVYDALHESALSRDVPLDLGEPEAPYIKPFAPAVFKMISAADDYDYYESVGEDPMKVMKQGESSATYAGKGCTTLVTEVPYFFEPRIQSDKEMPFTRLEAVLKKLDTRSERNKIVEHYYRAIEDTISDDNPFAKMVKMSVDLGDSSIRAERAFAEKNEAYRQPCKESEAMSNLDMPVFYALFTWGLLIRSMEHELAKSPAPEAAERLTRLKDECEEKMKADAEKAEAVLDYTVIPIRTLLGIQLASGLAVAQNV